MSILSEILVQLLGEGNASLGAVSLFSGALALIFSGLLFASTLDSVSFSDVGGPTTLVMATCALLAALLGFRTGRKAPNVTRRNLGMALVGTCLSLPAMLLAVATIAICVIRLLLDR